MRRWIVEDEIHGEGLVKVSQEMAALIWAAESVCSMYSIDATDKRSQRRKGSQSHGKR